ncbi:uncharacterized protein DC041_0001225 [Schistosoma bovis]|uniref:Gamma-secretase subunit PEN-2 n=1 Tax=Schistosoma bovis TaxID=6184 RepID=A0A430Q7Y0_SCHBO|nr:uncharacterized protein DC041_0001225 [Schistosoma bovis]
MDIKRLTGEDKLKLSRTYFFDVTFSLIGALSWTVVFAVWIITFLNFRIISQVENEKISIREESRTKGAIHVHIRLVPTCDA